MALLLETTLGDVVIDLDIDGSPELCKNFIQLAEARFYTSTLIFSVVPGRFCRCGDPVGDGSGGTCIYGLLGDEEEYRKSSRRFLASSAGRRLTSAECREKGRVVATCLNDIPDTIGSQFLITCGDQALDGIEQKNLLSLGVVVEDESGVLDKINAAYTDTQGRPYADIRIRRALVIHDPFEQRISGMEAYLAKKLVSQEGRIISSPSPERPHEEAVVKRISVEDVDLDEDMNSEDEAELREKLKREQEEGERRADKSRAVVLEMLGDLPDADIRAPEDVLFICKLNPETLDEDLELIFSRFDEKVKVEIIRDPDTGGSLQYAFAEFTSKKSAEEAYFKMNNALVDDRRIKVDFSQSVSKIWDKYNQRMRMPKSTGRDGSFHAPAKAPPPSNNNPRFRNEERRGSQVPRHAHEQRQQQRNYSNSGGREHEHSRHHRRRGDSRERNDRSHGQHDGDSRDKRIRVDEERRMERDDRRQYGEHSDRRSRVKDRPRTRETGEGSSHGRRRHYESDESYASREHRRRRKHDDESHKKRKRHRKDDDGDYKGHKKHKKERKHHRKSEKRSRRDRSRS